MFLSQLRGKDLFDCVGHLEKLSRQIASRGAITLNGTTAEKKAARNLLIEKIHEYERMYINTPQSYPEPQIPADILAIYSRLQLLPAKAVIDSLTLHMTLNMSRMDANEISGIPGYFANLGIYPRHDFMKEWWASAKSVSGSWDLKDTYRIIYQLAILDCISQQEGYGESPCPAIVRPIMNIIEARAEHFFPDFIDGQIYYAAKWFGYGFIEGRTIQASAEKISETEKALSAGLNGKGLTVLDDHVLHGTQHRFDLVVSFNRNSVGIEVDGPSHFVQDSENKCIRYDGSTRFHTALIEDMMGENFRVLRIPFLQLERANAIENVQQTLRHLNGFPKGAVYIMRGAKSIIQTDKTDSWVVAHPALHR
jgi:hypothetical protein